MENQKDEYSKLLDEVTKNKADANEVVQPSNDPRRIQKIYFALLNNGPIRREMSSRVIPAMQKTPGVKLIWEDPNRTFANPISSNRNMIVKRFLQTDCDYLLMIDDDVVPLHNPCELVHQHLDVLGFPALVRSSGQVINWTAYVPHSDGVGYSAIDLDSFDDMFDVLEVAIVGTGCILIKREVLEKVKAPFHSEFDDDGCQKYGTDFAFCRRATNAGFTVYTAIHRRCEHFKKVGLSNMDAWDTINYFDRANMAYGIPWGGYAISIKDWHFIKSFVLAIKPMRILEFGAGLSSLLLSQFAEVTCYETDPAYKEKIEAKITDKNKLTIKLWDGTNFPFENLENNIGHITNQYGLAFVDGPKQKLKGGMGREFSLMAASKLSDHIIVHDAGRLEEEAHQRKFFRSIFKLERKSGNHLTRCHYWHRRPHPVTLEEVKDQLNKR